MRRMTAGAVTALTVLAGPLAARQVPVKPGQYPTSAPEQLPPPKSVHPECYRQDVEQNKALVQKALATGQEVDPKDQERARTKTTGCAFYRISLVSTVTIEDTEVPGVSSKISGQGSITLGLAPDNAMAGYDFTSGVEDLTAPVYWTRGSARITKPGCEVTIAELPYTLFSFWLGATSSVGSKLAVAITPSGNEAHDINTRCKDPMGRWHSGPPGEKESIFTPAWIALHGEGSNKVAPDADHQALSKFTDDVVKAGPKPGDKPKPNKAYSTPALPEVSSPTGSLDVGKLQAMQDYMTKHPNASPAEMMAQMNGVVPNLDQQLEAAQDNFMFKAPGECSAVNATKWTCNLPSAPVTLSSRLGFGTIKRITEQTVITIEKVSAPAGAP